MTDDRLATAVAAIPSESWDGSPIHLNYEAKVHVAKAVLAALPVQPDLDEPGTTTLHIHVPLSDQLVPDQAARDRIERAAARAVMDAITGAVHPPAWVVPDGYAPDGVGACGSCHQFVLWVHTRAGKRAPLNPDGTSHFSNCPQAPQWRRTHPLAAAMPNDDRPLVEDHS